MRKWMTACIVITSVALLQATACDDSPPEGQPTTSSGPGTGPGAGGNGGDTGSGGSGGEGPDCYMNPTTHEEIINACTDAEQVDKNPVLPLLNPDGSLPPIP